MAIDYWVTHSLDKLFPDTEPPADPQRALALRAARNETEDAQVGIRVPAGTEIASATFALSDLVGPGRRRIARRHLAAYWQWYTYVLANPKGNTDPASYLRKAPAFFPDAFLEQTDIRIRDEWTQPLWVSVHVPAGTPAGTYHGTLTIRLRAVKDASVTVFTVPLGVEVWPFTLPAQPLLRHTEWFWPEVLANYYRLEPWGAAHWRWIRRVADDMVRHKQDMVLTPFYQLVQVTRLASGKLAFDFRRLDRWVRTFRRAGIAWLEGAHVARRTGNWTSAFGWLRFPLRDHRGRPVKTTRAAMSDAEFEPYLAAFLQAVHAHLKRRGWHRQYVQHLADEPIPANYQSWLPLLGKLRRWLPGVPSIDATVCEELTDQVDIRVPQIQELGPTRRRGTREDLWCYVCLAPRGHHVNRFVDYPSLRNRMIFWLCWSLRLKGFLHWGYNHWRTWGQVPVDVDVSPWFDATGGSACVLDRQPLPAGDPFIVYPGRRGLCSSLRWEVIRKGCEDFAYLTLLAAAVAARRGPAAARRRAAALLVRVRTELAVDSRRHTRDDATLLATRTELGNLLAVLCRERR